MKIAFLGLGVMGFPMAGHLARAGHEVKVYNRTIAKAQDWADCYRGEWVQSPAQAVVGAEVVCSCVGADDDLRAIALGEQGAFAAMSPGSIFLDHTTTSASVARELYAIAAERGLAFMDAPVSGGQSGAQTGNLTIMAGGDADVFDKVEPVLSCYSRAARLMGEVGSGQLTKMVNQICVAGVLQGLAEGLGFAEAAGLDIAEVVNVISKGAAQSWQMENRYQAMSSRQFDFGFAVDWMRKDLGIALAEAKNNGAQLPITQVIDGFYEEVQQMGGQRWDTSSLIARFNKD